MSKFPLGKIGDFATEISRPIALEPTTTYRSVGVKWYGEGVHIHEARQGHNFDAARFEIRTGDLIYNDMWARRGSVAVVPAELSGSVASSHFPTFELDHELIVPRYLHWFLKTSTFWEECEKASQGSTGRNQIKRRTFLAIPIPLPTIREQNQVVARIEELAAQVADAQKLRLEIGDDLHKMLRAAYHQIADTAPTRPLDEIAPLFRRPVTVEFDKVYPQVAARSFGRGTFHKPSLIGSEVTWQKPYLVRAGDILVSNIKAWEGAIAVAKPEDDSRVGSHRYLTFLPLAGLTTARFVCFHLLTPEGLAAVSQASPGSADRNRTLNVKAFSKIQVPVPDYAKQRWFDSLCGEVDELKRLQAETAVELDALMPAVLDKAFKGEL